MNIFEIKERLKSLGLEKFQVWYLIVLWADATERQKDYFEYALYMDTQCSA